MTNPFQPPKVADVAASVRMGAPIESLIPKGADPDYWQRLVDRYNANGPQKPKRKRAKATRHTSGKASRRRFQASNVLIGQIASAMAEQVDRVNGCLTLAELEAAKSEFADKVTEAAK